MATEEDRRTCFRRAIEDNIDALYGTALRLARNQPDAEDLVSETVTKAWSAFATLRDHERFRPWIFRILYNGFVSTYRRDKASPDQIAYSEEPGGNDWDDSLFCVLERMPDDFLAWWGNPEREYANKLLGAQISKAIDALPAAFRSVVMLINVEGFSYDETAEILNIPLGTVRSRMRRGRTLLQKSLWDMAQEAGIVLPPADKETTNG